MKANFAPIVRERLQKFSALPDVVPTTIVNDQEEEMSFAQLALIASQYSAERVFPDFIQSVIEANFFFRQQCSKYMYFELVYIFVHVFEFSTVRLR
jgi:hypothetical protein